MLIVMKFGGSSLASAAHIRRAAQLVAQQRQQGDQVAVVVSAQGDTTDDLIEKAKEQADPVTFHTDQGSVYSSQAFYNAHKEYNIIRSMSRAGKPTDNPIIESVNGWIKAELISEGWFRRYDSAEDMISDYVRYYNNDRPAYSLQSVPPVKRVVRTGAISPLY